MSTATPPRGRRAPVPSEREQTLGITADDLATAATPLTGAQIEARAEAEAEEAEERQRLTLRRFLHDIRPSVATGGHPQRPAILLAIPGIGRGLSDRFYNIAFPTIFVSLSLSYRTLTTLVTIAAVLSVFSPVGYGYHADRFSRRGILMVATILNGLGYVAFGLSPTFAMFVFFFIWKGVSAGLNVVAAPNSSLLSDYYPPEVRGRVFAFNANVSLICVALFTLLAGVVVEVFGVNSSFIAGGIVTSLGFIPLLFVEEPPRGRWDRIRLGAGEAAATRHEEAPSFGEAMRVVRSVRTVRRVCQAQVWITVSGLIAVPILQIKVIRAFGTSPMLVAVIGVAQILLTIVSFEIAGVVSDRMLKRRPDFALFALGIVYLINFAFMIVQAYVGIPILLFLISLVQILVSQIPTTSESVLLSQVIPARVRSFGLTLPQLYGVAGMVFVLPFTFLVPENSVGPVVILGVLLGIPGALVLLTAKVDVLNDMRAARAAVLAAETAVALRDDGSRTILVCRDVEVGYDGVQVLFGVDLDVAEGELIALLGTNGAGKSTLLRAITGLSEPSNGAIFIDGVEATHLPPHEVARLGVVFMPGGRGVFPTLTVAENLSLVGGASASRVEEVYELFPQLAARRGQLAGNLSGGEQQMVALGQALLAKPRMLLVDELSLGLAPAVVEQLLQALTAIHAKGTTVILVEQSVDLALTVADRAIFMEKGEIRFDGSAEELRRRPELLRSIYVKGTRAGGATAAPREPRPTALTTVLSARGLTVRYGGVNALTDADLDVAPGEVVGLIGPNGAGKTTLFDAICGFVPLAAGQVTVAGRDVTDLSPGERTALGLARSFQDAKLFGALTVTENVMIALHRKGSSGAASSALWLPQARRAETKLRRQADSLVDAVGLGDSRDKAPTELSTGMRRVLDLACQMAAAPDVLLLDEPSSGIAQAEAEELGPFLDRIRRDLGCGILLIEHDMSLLTSVADRLVGMVLGHTVVSGSVAEVTSDPRMVAAYLGTSERVLARSGSVTSGKTPPAGTAREKMQ
jgi:branched-chain amino acid transport system ATP-binding protein